MTREEYYRLRALSENKNLSEYEFQMKYLKKTGDFKYFETSRIKDLDSFKQNMNDIKNSLNPKIIDRDEAGKP